MVLGVAVCALVAIALCWVEVRHVRRVREARGRLFAEVVHLLTEPHLHQDGIDYPVLDGTYRGRAVRLRPIVDTLGLRKLPVLWLAVEYRGSLDVEVPLDILRRPTGTEFFSPNGGFAHEHPRPRGFPSDVRIASARAMHSPLLSSLEPYGSFLSDARAKELYLTDHGMRLVWLLIEGTQSHYRTTRRADFGAVRLEPAALQLLLDTLLEIGVTLEPSRVGTAR
jgi:hypothetical protein